MASAGPAASDEIGAREGDRMVETEDATERRYFVAQILNDFGIGVGGFVMGWLLIRGKDKTGYVFYFLGVIRMTMNIVKYLEVAGVVRWILAGAFCIPLTIYIIKCALRPLQK